MAVAAYKGGVAKTTLALELAYLMDAPLIDFEWDDGSASRRWGYRHERQHGRPLLDSLTRRSTPRPVRGRRKADLVPGHPALSAAELTAAQVTEAIEKWSVEWGRDWVFVDTHPGGFPTTLGAMAAADVVLVPTPLRSGEIDALGGMLREACDYPLLIVPTMVPRAPSPSLNRALWNLAQTFDVPLGPVVSWNPDLGERQQRLAISALDPTPARWATYVDELKAVAQAIEEYAND